MRCAIIGGINDAGKTTIYSVLLDAENPCQGGA